MSSQFDWYFFFFFSLWIINFFSLHNLHFQVLLFTFGKGKGKIYREREREVKKSSGISVLWNLILLWINIYIKAYVRSVWRVRKIFIHRLCIQTQYPSICEYDGGEEEKKNKFFENFLNFQCFYNWNILPKGEWKLFRLCIFDISFLITCAQAQTQKYWKTNLYAR